MAPESKLFLLDAHALCYRSYFAIKSLSTHDGQATNAVFGFTRTLRKILADFRPDYMAVCFDVGRPTYRHERFAGYKSHRPAMPDDLISQIPIIKEIVTYHGLPILEYEGFEADDVIATLCERMQGEGLELTIVSADKDMFQLLNPSTRIFNPMLEKFVDGPEVKALLGVHPSQVVDYLALTGDSTDNIPGVRGIGEVRARHLLEHYGDLEAIFKNIESLKPESARQALLASEDMARLSKELVTLRRDVPLALGLPELRVGLADTQKLWEIFQRLEFRTLAQEVAGQLAQRWEPVSVPVALSEQVSDLVLKIKAQGVFAFYFQGLDEFQMSLDTFLCIALDGEKEFRLPEGHWHEMKGAFEDERILKISYNLKESVKILSQKQFALAGEIFDVMLAAYLLLPSRVNFNLSDLAAQYLNRSYTPAEGAPGHACVIFAIYPILLKELQEKLLYELYKDIEIPLSFVLAEMESYGVRLDLPLLEGLSLSCEKKMNLLIRDIYKLAEGEFNLNSPKQLAQVLFERLKLPAYKKTKTGYSTDETVLLRLAEKYPIATMILEYRQLAKLKSTYIDALPKLVNPATGRVHASFHQAGTETGRLSSSHPNLQNIPIRTELGQEIRRAFIASSPDYVMISADYSQVELRILAHLSQDEALKAAFLKDEDIHAYTASLIFEVPLADVTDAMRDTAKRVNFGIVYGMSAFGLAKDLGISQPQAQDFIDRYFLRYPGVRAFMDACIAQAEAQGFVLTLLKRRRYLPEIHNSNSALAQFAQRQAINTPVQGSAADLIKLAMIDISREIKKCQLRSRMMITVHDELIFDVFPPEQAIMVDLIRKSMEGCCALSVPLRATIQVGKNWLQMQEAG